MTPRLAPQGRYRLIPHPSGTGHMGAVLDEASPLEQWRQNALAAWLDGPLHPVEYHSHTEATTTYVSVDGDHTAIVANQVARHLRLPMVATIVGSFAVPPHPNAPPASLHRLFGLATDGTLIAAVAAIAADPEEYRVTQAEIRRTLAKFRSEAA